MFTSSNIFKTILPRVVLFLIALLACAGITQAQSTAGTVIKNRVRVEYVEPTGQTVTTESPVVTVIVMAVNGVVVNPDETTPSGFVDVNTQAAVSFNVCNTGNESSAFIISDASVSAPSQIENIYLDVDASGTVTPGDIPVTLNVTATPLLAPAACQSVIVVYQVGAASPQSESITTLTARVAPGAGIPATSQDSGTIRRTVRQGPYFTDPVYANLPPRKLVNDVDEVVASPTQSVEFEIAFRNRGETTAQNVRVLDYIPAGLTYVAGSLRLTTNNQTVVLTDARDGDDGEVVGQDLEVRIPQLPSNEVAAIRFNARVDALPGGTVLVNRASVHASNAPSALSRDARVVVSPQGMVFDGSLGQSSPVQSTLRVLLDSATGPLALLPAGGYVPNSSNSNPFVTGASGQYSFRITAPTQAETYYLVSDADGYRQRVIQVNVTPLEGELFSVSLIARDGQPLAVANGFTLTSGPVNITALGSFAWNVPVFASGGLEIAKTVDRASAEIGDVVTYRVTVRNTLRTPAVGVVVTDRLPQAFYYVDNSGTLDLAGQLSPLSPDIAGDTLTFRLPDIPAGGTAAITYRVRIGPNARMGEQFNLALACHGQRCTPPTKVGVTVRGGIFSSNQLMIGRVFIDRDGDARFDRDDVPVAGARLVLSNGFTAITDAAGNYSFPVIADGALAIELDRSSVPEGFAPRDKRRSDGSRWSRIVLTPLQSGALLEASFALDAVSPTAVIPEIAPDKSVAASEPAPAQKKKRSRWGWLAFWRRDKRATRVETVKTTVIVPAASQEPCPPVPGATVAAAPAAPSPTPASVNTSSRQSTSSLPSSSQSPVKLVTVNPGTVVLDTPQTPAPAPTPEPSVQPAPVTSSGIGVATEIAPVSYVKSAPDSPAVVTSPVASAGISDEKPVTSSAAPAVAPGIPGVVKVAPGAVELDVEPQTLISGAGFNVPVRVALGWEARLYINGTLVDSARIGERRIDQTSQTEQVTFVGLSPAPGPNTLRAVAVSPSGEETASREVVIYGRGPAVRLEVEPVRSEIAAGRRDKTEIVIHAFDAWGNPAVDGEMAIQTSAGSFDGLREAVSVEMARNQPSVTRDGQAALVARPSELQTQRTFRLVGGSARVSLVAGESPGIARLKVVAGETSAQTDVRFVTEAGPRMIVGLGQVTIGRAAPVMDLRGTDENVRGSLAFFYRGRLWSDNILTLSYDSQRPLQRLESRDRLFQIDPLERNYFVFGDSSTRFSAAPSNSKLYARLDFGRAWGRSFALFGDFVPDQRNIELAAYNRKLTGAQVQFENSRGDYVSVAGARPDTAFGRDVFDGGVFGFVRLSASLILPGSETVTLEVRDRRNPDLIIKREPLQRGFDYNLDADTGQLFFVRSIQPFDSNLNLQQVVVTYEYQAHDAETNVYTLRASKSIGDSTRVGLTMSYQSQGKVGGFGIGGVDLTQKTPRGGELRFEWARSSGRVAGTGSFFNGDADDRRDGDAFLLTYDQPLGWREGRFQASFRRASANFFNPFSGTIVGGAQRAGVALDFKATPSARVRLGFTDERNSTDRVSNSRQTVGLSWTQAISDKLTATFGYDFRRLNDQSGTTAARNINSQMVTAGIEWKPTDRIQLSARREQNLAEADPTYPNQTVLSGSYRINDATRFFVTQRLSNAPIAPINDLTGAGFGFSQSRREFNAGIETKFLRDTSLVGGYRVESGIEGSDGFAVVGLQQKWKVNKEFALDAGFERAFHMTGKSSTGGYNSVSAGATWQPRSTFLANARYEFRDRFGSGHLFSAGFAGKPHDSITALGRIQFSRGSFENQQSEGVYGSFGVAVRPVKSDRAAAFFNYQYRSRSQGVGSNMTRESSNTLSADAFFQAHSKVALFGKFALKSDDSSRPGLVASPTLTYLFQGRGEYRIAPQVDVALESRFLKQPSTNTSRAGLAAEIGYWATPDVRFGVGYNATRAIEQPGRSVLGGDRRGFYFTITTRLERVFDFFGGQKKKDDGR